MAGRTSHPAGFRSCFSDQWVDHVRFDHDHLVAYLMTQSNVVDAIESGLETDASVRSWLAHATDQFFDVSETRVFGFHTMANAFRVVA